MSDFVSSVERIVNTDRAARCYSRRRVFYLVGVWSDMEPDRYISLTRSHAFDGGAVGGSWRVILVLDRDTNKLTAYHKDNCL